ncbi:unnamed protein product [Notodromas monacha]|uniref:RanBP2-type domain-containing protein n=1 Tax=Notodromas monacha TaxID=399045 RepID=A0A7R9GD06_9CRUS|nr:unnamed protein product [Notodromas monacha]CAG0916484.1 unnamed protein product [Notodromas monacha]
MKNTRSEGELRVKNNINDGRVVGGATSCSATSSPTTEFAPPMHRARTRSVDNTGARPRPVGLRHEITQPSVTSVRCVLHNNSEIRYEHAVLPAASPGAPVQHRSEVTVPVGIPNSPSFSWIHHQPSLIEVEDPLQIFDGTPALLSHSQNGSVRNQGYETGMQNSRRKDYGHALILHQKSRKDALEKKVAEERKLCMKLKYEKKKLEDDLMQRRQNRGTQFPTVKDLKELNEIVHSLRVKCELTNRRIQFFQGQSTAPRNGEFYSNMERFGRTGQDGRVPPPDDMAAVMMPQFSRSIPPAVAPGSRVTASVSMPDELQRASSSVAVSVDEEEGPHWSCPTCTFLNHPALSTCEQCDTLRAPNKIPTDMSCHDSSSSGGGVGGGGGAGAASASACGAGARTCYCCAGAAVARTPGACLQYAHYPGCLAHRQ